MNRITKIPPSREVIQNNRLMSSSDLADYVPNLLPCIKQLVYRDWTRGVRIATLAKLYNYRVIMIEAIIWEAQNDSRYPPTALATPTVRQSQSLHIVARKKAA